MEKSSRDGLGSLVTGSDIVGYAGPGGAFLLCVFLFEFWVRQCAEGHLPPTLSLRTPLFTAISFFSKPATDPQANWLLSLVLVAILLGTAYIAGHLLASASFLSLSRLAVGKGLGHPYRRLLELRDRSRIARLRADFYGGLCFWMPVYLVLLNFAAMGSWAPRTGYRVVGWMICAALLLKLPASAYLARHGDSRDIRQPRRDPRSEPIATAPPGSPARTLRQHISRILSPVLGSGVRAEPSPPRVPAALRRLPEHSVNAVCSVLMPAFALLPRIAGKFICNFTGTHVPFGHQFRGAYEREFQDAFGISPASARSENYWFSFMYLCERSPALAKHGSQMLRISGFARNFAAAFFCAFLYCESWLYFLGGRLIAGSFNGDVLPILLLIPAIYLCLGVLLAIRYYYLFAALFSRYVFRSFVFLRLTSGVESAPKTGDNLDDLIVSAVDE